MHYEIKCFFVVLYDKKYKALFLNINHDEWKSNSWPVRFRSSINPLILRPSLLENLFNYRPKWQFNTDFR